MTRGFAPQVAVAGLLLLSACHRHATADVTLDADQDARNATQAKIDADLAAADKAARAPLPRIAPAAPVQQPATPATDDRPPLPDDAPSDGDQDAPADGNDAR